MVGLQPSLTDIFADRALLTAPRRFWRSFSGARMRLPSQRRLFDLSESEARASVWGSQARPSQAPEGRPSRSRAPSPAESPSDRSLASQSLRTVPRAKDRAAKHARPAATRTPPMAPPRDRSVVPDPRGTRHGTTVQLRPRERSPIVLKSESHRRWSHPARAARRSRSLREARTRPSCGQRSKGWAALS